MCCEDRRHRAHLYVETYIKLIEAESGMGNWGEGEIVSKGYKDLVVYFIVCICIK